MSHTGTDDTVPNAHSAGVCTNRLWALCLDASQLLLCQTGAFEVTRA